ncbi:MULTISPECIES: hypothetical protein [Streptomyces]|uniref:hypothetical protein n=1 Tax=Streptomyces TaxID=1883 RepID=UPI0020CCF34D|nr:hypothetical protein [Streptomyces sudanensis]MCP9987592.1 hypothetical protein [Streptomyces sudanensis]
MPSSRADTTASGVPRRARMRRTAAGLSAPPSLRCRAISSRSDATRPIRALDGSFRC